MSVLSVVVVAAAATSGSAGDAAIQYSHQAEALALPLNLGAVDEAPAVPAVELDSAFGEAGSWRWNIWGGYGNDFDDASQGHFGGGVSWFIVKNLSLDLEALGLYFDQVGENAFGGNVNLLFRWHFLARDSWSLYADAGAGVLGTSDDVPADGTSFNFTPQAGAGVSFDIFDDVRLLTGVRWHHISNARTSKNNPGRDSVMLYAGISIPF